jgi:hypothetical protein
MGLIIIAILHWKLDHETGLSRAAIHLMQGRVEDASDEFTSLTGSPWVWTDADLGSAIVMAVSSDKSVNVVNVSAEADIARFCPNLLMLKLLRADDGETVLRLCQLAGFYGIDTSLFRAAVNCEKGLLDEAEGLLGDVKSASRLRINIHESLGLLRSGAKTIIRDRHGVLLGYIDPQGNFVILENEVAGLLQPVYRAALVDAPDARGLRLALDFDLSRACLEILDGEKGSIVVLEPISGEILVAVSDPETWAESGHASSPAFEQLLEPASISKLITTVAAFRAGIEVDRVISKIDSVFARRYQGGILYNPSELGQLRGLEHALAGSCNIAFADLGIAVGWEGIVAELQRFGYDQAPAGFDLGKILRITGNERQLADLSIGLEHSETTALHAALQALPFANGGFIVSPRFLNSSDGYLGVSPQTYTIPRGIKLMESAWLAELTTAMEAVGKWGGTAGGVAPYDYPAAMKTGTGGNYREGFHVNYIGFCPVDSPEFVFCVRITDKSRSVEARRAGQEITRSLLWTLRSFAHREQKN